MTYPAAKDAASMAMEKFRATVGEFVTNVESGFYVLDDGKAQHESLMEVNHTLQRMQLAIGQYIDYANARINYEKQRKPTIN